MSLPTKPGNAERGWNDPPVLLHSPGSGLTPTGAATPPKRTALNKRVAYPVYDTPALKTSTLASADGPPPLVNPSTNHSVTPELSDAPPGSVMHAPPPSGVVLFPPATTTDIPKFTAPIIVPTMNHAEATLPIVGSPTATNPITNAQVNVVSTRGDDLGIPDFDDDTQMYHYTMSKLQKTLVDVKSRLQPKTVEVVGKKLEILSSMWESGSLSYEVKSSMARLATALHRRRCELAHDIHMALMMDYVSEVGQWMVGVKRLIQEARGVEAPVSPTDTTIAVVAASSDAVTGSTAGVDSTSSAAVMDGTAGVGGTSSAAGTGGTAGVDSTSSDAVTDSTKTHSYLSQSGSTENSENVSLNDGPSSSQNGAQIGNGESSNTMETEGSQLVEDENSSENLKEQLTQGLEERDSTADSGLDQRT